MCKQKEISQSTVKNDEVGSRRTKLWEIHPTFLCSIIGTCLTLSDIHKILKSSRITYDKRLSEYDIHNAFVGQADTCSKATRQANKLMDNRYATEVRQLSKARTEAALTSYWDKGLRNGAIAGMYWALVTHPLAAPTLKMRAYGEVHMLSHQIGANKRDVIKHNAGLEQQYNDLQDQLLDTQEQNKQIISKHNSAIKSLKSKLSRSKDYESKLTQAEQRIQQLESGKALKALNLRVNKLKEDYLQSHYSETRAIKKRDNLVQQLNASQNSYIALKKKLHEQAIQFRQLQQAISSNKNPVTNTPEIPCQKEINLCGRCVLFVGGRTGQCSHFRKLVENNNGRFIHHDGGREDCPQRLASILPQADVVLCPIDCVSHDAMYRIKRFCSDYAKQLVFMPRASLSAFTQSLKQVAE